MRPALAGKWKEKKLYSSELTTLALEVIRMKKSITNKGKRLYL